MVEEHAQSKVPERSGVKAKKKVDSWGRPVTDAKLRGLRPYPKGVSGNPGGMHHEDVAAEIARAVISGNKELIYEAMARTISKGNAYAYAVLADRGYGKLKERTEVTHVHQEVEDGDLHARIKQLETDLGLAREIDEAGRIGILAAGSGPAVEPKKDSKLLSRRRAVKA